ncbi:DUF6636 domain-containing protein [Alkalinema pantanalense CENA528]|uniref:DUF6636 domain-containing protein n=1 Tax=Alkalinema pantanalense TaxID=1620705 RepID=UPI003D6DB540
MQSKVLPYKALAGLTIGNWMIMGLSIAAVFAIGQPAKAIENSDGFLMPSKNIACISHDSLDDARRETKILRCEILSKLNPMPPQPKSCQFDWGNGFLLTKAARKAEILCVSDTMYSPEYPTLDYGKTWKKNGFSCQSRKNGLTCTNGKGNGFFLNREDWKAF